MTGHDEELRLCRLEIARLSEENGILRISSESFGALAERLKNRLKVAEGAVVLRANAPNGEKRPR